MYSYINNNSISNFYKHLKFTGFVKISDERKEELDIIVSNNITYFTNITENKLSLMSLLADRLTTSYKNYGLLNGDEKAYFWIKLLDPKLQHLAVFEATSKTSEVKKMIIKNLDFYDKRLLLLEQYYNKRFHEYEEEELWSRDNIKR